VATALILSSLVAASRIGGGLQQTVLAADGIEPVLAPTIMLSRSPAKGGVGQATSPQVFRAMLGDIEADASFGMVDLVITGYFASAQQVEIAADMLERLRASRQGGRPILLVDPVMGDDERGLYVPLDVADAIRRRLAPQADYLTPNLWELSWLLGQPLADREALRAASARFDRPMLVTSVPAGDGEIGVFIGDSAAGSLIIHARRG
jgi:pyridoxine kinase